MNTSTLSPTMEIKNSPLSNYTVNPKVSEKQFDEFTALIANLCEIPKAVITLLDGQKLWIKSGFGISDRYLNLSKSYCQFTIGSNDLTEFSDVDTDPSLTDCEWRHDHPHIKFYAGVPLVSDQDGTIGTLCIMDSVPHVLTERQKQMLQDLGKMVSSLMASRRNKVIVKEELRRPTDHPGMSLRGIRTTSRSW